MSVLSRLMQLAMVRRFNLPTPERKHRIRKTSNIRVPVDGVYLLADLYQPEEIQQSAIVLVRSPYGKGALISAVLIPFVERGYQVLIQCCRGTGGSEGTFDPHHDDRRDGLATLDWIRKQPWYGGAIVTYGASYLGYTQWAVADEAGADVKAMAMQVTLSNFADMTYAGGSLMLQNAFLWTRMMARAQRGFGVVLAQLLDRLPGQAMTTQRWKHLPLARMDEAVIGRRVKFWKDWMEHDSPGDPWWQPVNCHRRIGEVEKPISMVAGWYDIFLPWQLRDFADLQRAGRDVRITIGPWCHTDTGLFRESILDALEWFDKQLHNKPVAPRKPVKAFLIGADQWCFFDTWPPREAIPAAWRLHAGGGLSEDLPAESAPDTYTYDPENPTPSVGGPALTSAPYGVDNRDLEAREDVLVYTSAELAVEMDIVGPIAATLYIGSDADSADFFIRLCDVRPDGTSINITDGYERIAIESRALPQKMTVTLWPAAYRIRAGHRLRIQISSGAFPRWSRNLGYGDRLGQAERFRKARQLVYHEPARVSEVIISVLPRIQ